MKPQLVQLDPVSVYLDYLIRMSLPRSVQLKSKDIFLSRALCKEGSCAEYPNTLVIEHRQSRSFMELAGSTCPIEIEDPLFKSEMANRRELYTRRIKADVTNAAGWYYGRPMLLTVATMVDRRTGPDGPPDELMDFIMTNTYLGDAYPSYTEGLEKLPELSAILKDHYEKVHEELARDSHKQVA